MTITLTGEPRSTQHLYKYACRGRHPAMYMTAAGKALKESYQWQARSQYQGDPLTGPVAVTATLYFETKRRADIDNFNKLWADACSGIVWEDDVQIEVLRIEKAYDKKAPRIVLNIEPLPSFRRSDKMS